MKVLYEDNHTIAVVKPSGIPVMPDASGDECMMDIVKQYLKEKYNKPGKVFLGLVHRLDRPTGGVMVFARTSKGASRLSAQIRDTRMEKVYYALVEGNLENLTGKIESYLLKDRKLNKSNQVIAGIPGAKRAVLEYQVMKEKKGVTLLSIKLITGRHHQIRAQFSSLGHPIIGDTKYNSTRKNHNLALWSGKLKFFKPVGGDEIAVEAKPDYESDPWSLIS